MPNFCFLSDLFKTVCIFALKLGCDTDVNTTFKRRRTPFGSDLLGFQETKKKVLRFACFIIFTRGVTYS